MNKLMLPWKIDLDSNFNKLIFLRENDLQSGIVDNDIQNYLNELLMILKKSNAIKFLQESIQKGAITLVVGGQAFLCKTSFIIDQKNHLCFFDENGLAIVLEQRHLYVSSIYLPRLNIIVKIDFAVLDTKRLIEECLSIEEKFRKNKSLTFSSDYFRGIFVSYGRPYHYFYDLLPAFYDCISKYYFEKVINLYLIDGMYFLDSTELCEGILKTKNCLYSNEQALNEDIAHTGYVLKLGYPIVKDFEIYRHELINYFDNFLLEKIKYSIVNEKDNISLLDENLNSHFILWVGICAEKRSWREQIRGIELCVREALKKYEKITLIVDGITMPLGKNCEKDVRLQKIIKNETNICNSIANSLMDVQERLRIHNIVGKKSIDKIRLSREANFFITGFLTDSMYPARFGQISGIGHGSYAARYSDHIHPKTIIMKSSKKRDDSIFENKNTNWARQSYSIRSGEVAQEFKKFLDSIE